MADSRVTGKTDLTVTQASDRRASPVNSSTPVSARRLMFTNGPVAGRLSPNHLSLAQRESERPQSPRQCKRAEQAAAISGRSQYHKVGCIKSPSLNTPWTRPVRVSELCGGSMRSHCDGERGLRVTPLGPRVVLGLAGRFPIELAQYRGISGVARGAVRGRVLMGGCQEEDRAGERPMSS